jgi:hypothetical protein
LNYVAKQNVGDENQIRSKASKRKLEKNLLLDPVSKKEAKRKKKGKRQRRERKERRERAARLCPDQEADTEPTPSSDSERTVTNVANSTGDGFFPPLKRENATAGRDMI